MMRRFDPLRVESVLWIDLLRAPMTTSAEVPVDVSRCRSREKERKDALEAEDIKEKDADGLLGIACGVCLSL